MVSSRELSPSASALGSGVSADLVARLQVRWEQIDGSSVRKINRVLAERKEAANEIAALDFERTALRAERDGLLEVAKMMLRTDDEWKALSMDERTRVEAIVSKATGQ